MCSTTRTPRRSVSALLFALALLGGAGAQAATAFVSSETEGLFTIDLDTLEVVARYSVGGKGPRGIAITADGRHILTANRDTEDLSVLDATSGKVLHRIPIGKSPEFIRIEGNFAYVTNEPSERPRGPAAQKAAAQAHDDDDDDDKQPARISVIDLKQWKVVRTITTGLETEGIEFSPDGSLLLVTNEGDDTVTVYRQADGSLVKRIDMPKGSRPRGIRMSPDGAYYAVTLENIARVVLLDAKDYRSLREIQTGASPYGISFDHSGQHLVVAAARSDALQVFDTKKDFALAATLPVGKRCWHFSYTPDEKQLLAACGRSNAVYVFDAKSYKPVRQIDGIAVPWGIVTNPRSLGSLDEP